MELPTALYIDDDLNEVEGDIRRLTRSGKIYVEYSPPPKNLALEDEYAKYEAASLFYVDWLLDETKNPASVGYRGRTLATHLRERFSDKPIILVSKEPFLNANQTSARRFIQSLNLFNGYVAKHEVADDVKKVVNDSLIVINSFERLRTAPKTVAGFHEVLAADAKTEANLLGSAAPPLGGVQDENELPGISEQSNEVDEQGKEASSHWAVTPMASWIQNVFLAYPGIIYETLYAATYLGITEEEFCRGEVQQLFAKAQYTGAFAPTEGRWWRGRLIRIAKDFLRQADINEPLNSGFSKAFEKLHGIKLKFCTCIYSGEQPANWVCYVLRKPVKIEYSLVYHPDARPAIMDDARVSFKAIRESNAVNDELFDATSQGMLVEVRSLDEDSNKQ